MHQSTRSKKLVDFLHGFGLSVDYSRILRLETQLANSVIESTREEGVHLPTNLRKGTFIFFAVDNSDFNEDTPDRKRTSMLQLLQFINDRNVSLTPTDRTHGS